MSYREELERREAREAARPKREYLSNEEWRQQKAALTRAINRHNPRLVLATVEKAVARWNETTWPDAWANWRIALEDAGHQARRDATNTFDADECERLDDLGRELEAAAIILFNF